MSAELFRTGTGPDLEPSLSEHLSHFHTAPFLFVGSGLSRRYFGLTAWRELLRRFAAFTPHTFEYYVSQANNDLPRVAAALALEFHKVWFSADQYAASRQEWASHATDIASPLKFEIAKYIRSASSTRDTVLSEELEALRRATVDGVITTNWDLLLESIFRDFAVYKSQDSLLFSNTQAIAEIYKIHGCCTDPNSLVLTADDYANFNERNAYLAAKLTTIFIEHPIIFLGYSLTDPNIAAILGSITACLGTARLRELGKNLIFVQHSHNHQETFAPSFLKLGDAVLPLTIIATDNFSAIYKSIQSIRRRFPARMLRQLKSHVYELVKSNDPRQQMHVVDLAADTDPSKVELVYGVGAMATMGEIGYRRLRCEQLLRDVVFDGANLDAMQIVRHTLPDLLGYSRYVPMYKYLEKAGYIGRTPADRAQLHRRVNTAMIDRLSCLKERQPAKMIKQQIETQQWGIQDLDKRYSPKLCLRYMPYIAQGMMVLKDLQRFLQEHWEEFIDKDGRATAELKRLVCFYDVYRYGPFETRTA